MSVKHSKTTTPDLPNLLLIKKLRCESYLTFLFTLFLFTYESANRSPKALPNGSFIEIVFCYTFQRQIVNWSALFTFLNSEIRTYILGARIRRRFNADVDAFVSIWSYMYMCVEEKKRSITSISFNGAQIQGWFSLVLICTAAHCFQMEKNLSSISWSLFHCWKHQTVTAVLTSEYGQI